MLHGVEMKKAIILAAGRSKRLRPQTNNRPKCLLKLGDETILDFQLKSLIRCGIDQILLVIGYKKDVITNYIKQSYSNLVKIVENDFFEKTDNAYSTALALDYVDTEKDSVIILDGDIVFDPKLLQMLIDSKHKNVLIADNDKIIESEDNKILIKENFVISIGKNVLGNAVYTSIIKLSGIFLKKFTKEVIKPHYKQEWYSKPLNLLLMKYPKEVHVIYTNGLLRCEVDTHKDLICAKDIYKKLSDHNREI